MPVFERLEIPQFRPYRYPDDPAGGGKLKRIYIGDDVWIGANAIIMDDVGNGSVVGAGSVVTLSVEPYSIVAGNPGRVLRSRLMDSPEPSYAEAT